MREFIGRSQGSYKNGDLMCTSASMCMAMSIISQKINVCSDDGINLIKNINDVMNMASRAQGKIEVQMNNESRGGRDCYTQRNGEQVPHCMISAKDMLCKLGIDIKAIGIGVREYVMCAEGQNTHLKLGNEKFPFQYEASSCFIMPEHLPECLISTEGYTYPLTCVLTSNGHSVCVTYANGRYSFFDPIPSIMIVDMNRTELLYNLYSRGCICRGSSSYMPNNQCDASIVFKEK